jgi:hypothetical protein
MNEPSLIARQRALLHDLANYAVEKARTEPALAASFRAAMEREQQEFARDGEALRQGLAADREAADEEFRQAREAIDARFAADQESAQREDTTAREELAARFDAEQEAAESAVQEARWAADAVLEGAKEEAATRLCENNARLAADMEALGALGQDARTLVEGWNQPAEEMEAAARRKARSKKGTQPRPVAEYIQEVGGHLAALQGLVVPGFLKGKRVFFFTVLLWLALLVPLGWLGAILLKKDVSLVLLLGIGAAASFVVSGLAGLIGHAILESLARKQVGRIYMPLCEVLQDAEPAREQHLASYQAEHDQALLAAKKRCAREMAAAQAKQAALVEINQRRAVELAHLDRQLARGRKASDLRRADDLVTAERRLAQTQVRLREQFETDRQQLEARHQARLDEIVTRHQGDWQALVQKWQQGLAAAQSSAAEINEQSDALFPGWDDPRWTRWQPPSAAAPALRFGSFEVRTESVVDVVPWAEERSPAEAIDLTLPALCAFPDSGSLLFHTHDEGRARAVGTIQAVMFRLLTSLPAGKVRFIIVDPVGLGQNFAAFMNLADYDEALVTSRIWTEAVHIEHRLSDLTTHMENVIQKYLRNRYATITEYNAHADEVAEPFRVLVVANFPANFTTEAARRLVSIAQSGPRCGVTTLISLDTKQALPRDFDLADLERCCNNLLWDEERFGWRDETFGAYPLALDRLPEDEFCNRILQQVGEAARGAHRVEVPFEFIAPAPERWWTGSTRLGLSVPLGRAGATRRQHLELGKGTSQHALVVGKTGSGKSTLLHALITNLALLYSPDEVELYLIDFKKGVEFKTYASHELPHARVIAIESEREFGLSVLQRLDAELKARGERFRAVGAQDLGAYRQAASEARSPRILLIVDEFQEFFVEDDRLAAEAAQLLDRLVRQGRAFGMHVLLGSQTIGGAYSLARSTIDQMAVRIALQCSEADAHLVLSDDNSAARLLSRPGEAIYNDANGLVEGNDPFQVVWLGEAQRERYLGQVQDLARSGLAKRSSAVVFEGNASADVRRNHLLERLLAAPSPSPAGDEPSAAAERAWLGEAMAIDELTTAVFKRQNGSNLLMVGQQPEAAQGMLATAVISLAAHHGMRNEEVKRSSIPHSPFPIPHSTRFYIVDGHQAGPPQTGLLARLPRVVPERVRLAGWRDVPAILAELSAELDRRQKASQGDAPSIYLVLYGLHRMRDLRRSEDDFGFMSRGEEQPATPDKQLAALLREGTVLGMHTLIWCDTLNNLQRALDRQAMREFAMRVVFQLSVADSSNLIDSPAASKLGLHRALFANEEDGRLEKFRPYGMPAEEWLAWVREELHRGSLSQPAGAPTGTA